MSLPLIPKVLKTEILYYLEPKKTTSKEVRYWAREIVSLSLTNREFRDLCQKVLNTLKNVNFTVLKPEGTYPIRWLNEGNYVVIRTGGILSIQPRGFHACLSSDQTSEQINEYLKKTRVVFYDVTWIPELLNEGALPATIERAGFKECKCKLKTYLCGLRPKDVPYGHQVYITD